jgi:peptidoglycan-associated lipoprotein
MAQSNLGYWGLVFVFGLAVGGCAPSTTPKPEGTPSSAAGAKSPAGQQSGAGKGSGTKESATTPGSLDALQKGQSTATPASSPLKDVFFEFDRYDLRADAREVLKANADWLKKNSSARVEIEGHCDERGTSEYNLALGAKRAQSAKDYLATLGIAGDRLSTISYGAEIPVCKQSTEDCWRQNRRARFVIIPSRPAS